MTSRFRPALWLALALACGTALAEPGIRWAPNIETARNAAVQFKVPLLIHFYGDNCLPCKMLEERVYSKPEAVETLNKIFHLRTRECDPEYGSCPRVPGAQLANRCICQPRRQDALPGSLSARASQLFGHVAKRSGDEP